MASSKTLNLIVAVVAVLACVQALPGPKPVAPAAKSGLATSDTYGLGYAYANYGYGYPYSYGYGYPTSYSYSYSNPYGYAYGYPYTNGYYSYPYYG